MKDFLRNGKLVTLMLGNLPVDSYVGVIPVQSTGQSRTSSACRDH